MKIACTCSIVLVHCNFSACCIHVLRGIQDELDTVPAYFHLPDPSARVGYLDGTLDWFPDDAVRLLGCFFTGGDTQTARDETRVVLISVPVSSEHKQ